MTAHFPALPLLNFSELRDADGSLFVGQIGTTREEKRNDEIEFYILGTSGGTWRAVLFIVHAISLRQVFGGDKKFRRGTCNGKNGSVCIALLTTPVHSLCDSKLDAKTLDEFARSVSLADQAVLNEKLDPPFRLKFHVPRGNVRCTKNRELCVVTKRIYLNKTS
ncbi:hypothetical protein K0M31_003604 [Melipona bicolor]|uniref:Uncharacterized protein n=1 Tax=Melipona bicolor TaxID=60889 RepID=A0AA40FZ52_9HYME|nr:hypothetical protein K0M31_003604 [Melipona bicolor]